MVSHARVNSARWSRRSSRRHTSQLNLGPSRSNMSARRCYVQNSSVRKLELVCAKATSTRMRLKHIRHELCKDFLDGAAFLACVCVRYTMKLRRFLGDRESPWTNQLFLMTTCVLVSTGLIAWPSWKMRAKPNADSSLPSSNPNWPMWVIGLSSSRQSFVSTSTPMTYVGLPSLLASIDGIGAGSGPGVMDVSVAALGICLGIFSGSGGSDLKLQRVPTSPVGGSPVRAFFLGAIAQATRRRCEHLL